MALLLRLAPLQSSYRAAAAPAPLPVARFRPLPPLLCHPGGKSKSKGVILPRIPPHRVYVEPFFGGGSVFFGKPPAAKSVLNDIDRPLMNFYRRLDCARLRRCVAGMVAIAKARDSEKLRSAWWRRANRMAAGSSESCDVFIGKTYGYGCKSGRPSFAPSTAMRGNDNRKGGATKVKRCPEYKERLRNATILSQDYQAVMRRFDGRDTFFYLDPPWLGVGKNQEDNGQYYRGKATTSPETVCSFLRKVKGKFLLHYDDNPRIQQACRGFQIERVPWATSMYDTGGKKKHALLISNFKTKAR